MAPRHDRPTLRGAGERGRAIALLLVVVMGTAGLLPTGSHGSDGQREPLGAAAPDGAIDAGGRDIGAMLRAVGPFFIENRGQISDPDVLFYAQGDPLSVGLTRWGLVFSLREGRTVSGALFPPPSPTRSVFFSMTLDGSSGAEPRGVTEIGTRVNVFKGSDPSGWVTGARCFSEVAYDALYPGVGLRFYFKDGDLKYAFDVDPEARTDVISMSYRGLEAVSIDGRTGDLVLRTALGSVRDARPVLLQPGLGPDGTMPGDYVRTGEDRIGFSLPDGCRGHMPLVIDPGLEFSTYIGGTGSDYGKCIGLDKDGNIVIAGMTSSIDFPTTIDSYDPSPGAEGQVDMFVAKFDPSGSGLIFSTYIGGSAYDDCVSIALASDGSVFCAGYTTSQDFPVNNPFAGAGGPHESGNDGVVLKLSADGSSLPFSSVFGGDDDDAGFCVQLLADGSVILGGVTESFNFPTTPGSFCSTRGFIPDWDMFVARLNRSLKALDFSGFLGGKGREGLSGGGVPMMDLVADASGRVFVFGATNSVDFPITPGTNKTWLNTTADPDTTVTIIDPTGSEILKSTYFGGSWVNRADDPCAIALGLNGSVYIGGGTASEDLNVTADAMTGELPSAYAGYLAVLDPELKYFQYCTYLGGGTGTDSLVDGLAWSPDHKVLYVLLRTEWTSWPTTPGTFDGTGRGNIDYFLMAVWASNFTVKYSTYVGGSGGEGSSGIIREMTVDEDGKVLLVGVTGSDDFPTTPGAFSRTFNGSAEAFLLRLDPRPCVDRPVAPSNLSASAGDGVVNITWDVPSPVGSRVIKHYLWWGLSSTSITGKIEVTNSDPLYKHITVMNGKEYFYQLSAVNSVGEGPKSAIVSAKPLGRPDAPENFRAANLKGVVCLNWTRPGQTGGEITGYHILRQQQGGSPALLTAAPDAVSYVDPDVQLGVVYTYRVRAFNERWNGSYTEPLEVTPRSIPGAPSNLLAVGGDRQVALSWQPPLSDGASAIVSFLVYRGLSSEAMVPLLTLPRANLSLTDRGLVNTESYYYCVYAKNAEGTGPPSETVQAVPRGAPTEPLDLVAVPGNGLVALSWKAPLSDGGYNITGYKVMVGTDPKALKTAASVKVVNDYICTALKNGVAYYFQVIAVNDFGEGPRSETQKAIPAGPPGAVQNLLAIPGAEQVTLMWQLPTETGGMALEKMRVFRGTDPDQLEPFKDRDATTTEFIDYEAVVGVTYYYVVVAVSSAGEGVRSDLVSGTAYGAPGAPTDVLARAGDGLVTLTWGPPASDGGRPVVGYTVFRGETPNATKVLVELGQVQVYVDREVINGRLYYYRVRASNEAGMGESSEPAPATPIKPVSAPGVPLSLRVVVEGTKSQVTWVRPTSDGGSPLTGFIVLRGPSADNMTKLAEVGLVESYVDTGLEPGKSYYYSVLAKNAAGQSERPTAVLITVAEEKKEEPGFGAFELVVAAGLLALAARGRRRRARPDRQG